MKRWSQKSPLRGDDFETQLDLLWNRGTGAMWLGAMRGHAAQLNSNIAAIEAEMPEYFALREQAEQLRTESDGVVPELVREIVPALDDQLFFLVPGPAPPVDASGP